MIDIHPGIITPQNLPEFQKRPRISEMMDRSLDNTSIFRRNIYQYLKRNALVKWITIVMLTRLLLLTHDRISVTYWITVGIVIRRTTSQTFCHTSSIINFRAMSCHQNQEESDMEELLQQGIDGLNNGQYSSAYSVAKSLGISARAEQRTTISTPWSCFAAIVIRLRRKGSCQMDYNSDTHWITSFLLYNRNDRVN